MGRGGRGVLAAACLMAWGCGGPATRQSGGGLGQAAGDAASDTKVLERATAAANEVIRAAGDCDAVQARLEAAQRALDEASREVRTTSGRASLDALGRQVRRVAEACP